jgi:hypothetical protein
MQASPTLMPWVWARARLTEGLRRLVVVRSAAVRVRRRCATRGRACRGWGAHSGVEVVTVSSGEGRRWRWLQLALE